MIQKIFTIKKDALSSTGYYIIVQGDVYSLEMLDCIIERLEGTFISAANIIDMIDTIQLDLAGINDSFVMLDEYSFRHRSILKTFKLKPNGTIDDTIDGFLENIQQYESYHIIEMDRDTTNDDSTIHAYIHTPKYGRMLSEFDKNLMLNAKQNNIKYWVEDYFICTDSNNRYAQPKDKPIEIL